MIIAHDLPSRDTPIPRIHELTQVRLQFGHEIRIAGPAGNYAPRLATCQIHPDITFIRVRKAESFSFLPIDIGVRPLHAQLMLEMARQTT